MKRALVLAVILVLSVAPVAFGQVASTPDTNIGGKGTTGEGEVDRGVGGSEYGGTGESGVQRDSEGGGMPIGLLGAAGVIGFIGIAGRMRARARREERGAADRAA